MEMIYLGIGAIICFIIWLYIVEPIIGLMQWWKEYSNEEGQFYE